MPDRTMAAPELFRGNVAAQTVASRHGMSVDALWSVMNDRERMAAMEQLQKPQGRVNAEGVEAPRVQPANPSYQERPTGPHAVEDLRGLGREPRQGMGPMSVMPDRAPRGQMPGFVSPEQAQAERAPATPGAPPPGAQNPMVGPEPHDQRNPRAREIVQQRRRDEVPGRMEAFTLVDPELPSGYTLQRILFPNRDPNDIKSSLEAQQAGQQAQQRDPASASSAPADSRRPHSRSNPPPEQRGDRALSFGEAGQRAAGAAAATAPATAAALQEGARRMSVQNVPGRMPSAAQYERAGRSVEQHFLEVFAPAKFDRLLQEGRFAEAYAWKDFYQSKAGRDQVNHYSRSLFALTLGDDNTFFSEATKAVAGSEIGDMYEIVSDKSRFLGENDDLFARITFRNRQTGEEFVQSFSTMEEVVEGLTSIASVEATHERKQASIQQRIAAIMDRQASDEDKMYELTKLYQDRLEEFIGEGNVQGMSIEDRQETAVRLAHKEMEKVRGVAQAGVGNLGVSQGGSRDPSVPVAVSP